MAGILAPWDWVILAVIIGVLFLGHKRLPGLGRALGQGVNAFRKAWKEGPKGPSRARESAARGGMCRPPDARQNTLGQRLRPGSCACSCAPPVAASWSSGAWWCWGSPTEPSHWPTGSWAAVALGPKRSLPSGSSCSVLGSWRRRGSLIGRRARSRAASTGSAAQAPKRPSGWTPGSWMPPRSGVG